VLREDAGDSIVLKSNDEKRGDSLTREAETLHVFVSARAV